MAILAIALVFPFFVGNIVAAAQSDNVGPTAGVQAPRNGTGPDLPRKRSGKMGGKQMRDCVGRILVRWREWLLLTLTLIVINFVPKSWLIHKKEQWLAPDNSDFED